MLSGLRAEDLIRPIRLVRAAGCRSGGWFLKASLEQGATTHASTGNVADASRKAIALSSAS